MKVKPALYRIAHTSTIIAFLCILSTTTVVMAANVTLRWDPSHPTPDGYRVFARKGQQAYNYSQPDWEGTGAVCTLDNLEGQTEYYFVVRAYDGSLESSDSSEAHYIPPVMDNDGDGVVNGIIIDPSGLSPAPPATSTAGGGGGGGCFISTIQNASSTDHGPLQWLHLKMRRFLSIIDKGPQANQHDCMLL